MSMETGAVERPPLSPLVTSDLMHTPQIGDALDNARANCALGLDQITPCSQHERTLMICAGGPSLADYVDKIRDDRETTDSSIIAINDTYDYLAEHDIPVDYFAMCEIAPWPKEFLVRAGPGTVYYMCSIAHPTAVARLMDAGLDVRLWHVSATNEDSDFRPPYTEIVEGFYPGTIYLGGGEAMSMKAINLGMVLGYRKFEMYGVDGCYRNGEASHVYMDRKVAPLTVQCAGREFVSSYYLARQADDLRRMCAAWHQTFSLKCHGDGLVQHMHRTGWPGQYDEV